MALNASYGLFDTAMTIARNYHRFNHSVTITEYADDQLIATWELEAGSDTVVFDCNEQLCANIDKPLMSDQDKQDYLRHHKALKQWNQSRGNK
jgi:hypothetical protein